VLLATREEKTMKRFPKAPYLLDRLHRLFVTAMLALAALALLGKAAHAQCSDPDDAPAGVYSTFEELLGGRFPLSEAECEKIVKTAVAACHSAVSDAVQCVESLFKSVTKARKTACSPLEGEERTDCNESVATLLESVEEDLALEAQEADAVCDSNFAESLSDDCLGIGPK
jgi:hypothetical protein